MYENVKSRVKFCNEIGNEFFCSLGERQGECLSPLLFSLFLNDIEEQFVLSGFDGIDLNMFKMFMLLYADYIVIFLNTAEELQYGLNLLSEYCAKWKLKVNVLKSKILIIRAGGLLPRKVVYFLGYFPMYATLRRKYVW